MKFENLEPIFSELIESGEFRVDSDGTIWRCGKRKRGVGPTRTKLVMITPERAEYATSNGYLNVRTLYQGRTIHVSAHRLVRHVLVGPIPNGMCINHLDGNRANNHPSNLEVVDHAGNMEHARRVLGYKAKGAKGERNRKVTLTDELVRVIRIIYGVGQHTQEELGELFGVCQTAISKIVTRIGWSHVI